MNPTQEIVERFEKIIEEELKKLDALENRDEKIIKFDFIFNMHKIINNYKDLKPLLIKFFDEKAKREKWEKEK